MKVIDKGGKAVHYAVIDIGSNTVKLNTFSYTSDGVTPLEFFTRRALLGSYKCDGVMSETGISVLISVLNEYLAICKDRQITRVFPYATQSLRGIDNSSDVLHYIKSATGLDIDIIDGVTEARLGLEAFTARYGVVSGVLSDMGGGSTELTFMSRGQTIRAASLPFGALSLKVGFGIGFAPNSDEKEALYRYIKGFFGTIDTDVQGDGTLYASGGTALGVFSLLNELCGKNDTMTVDEAEKLYEKVLALPDSEQLVKGLCPERHDVLMTGFAAHLILCDIIGCKVISAARTHARDAYAAAVARDKLEGEEV